MKFKKIAKLFIQLKITFETMRAEDDMQEDKFGKLGVANEQSLNIGAKILQLRTTKTQYSPQYSMEESSKVRQFDYCML